jgi:hypothetical protein
MSGILETRPGETLLLLHHDRSPKAFEVFGFFLRQAGASFNLLDDLLRGLTMTLVPVEDPAASTPALLSLRVGARVRRPPTQFSHLFSVPIFLPLADARLVLLPPCYNGGNQVLAG